jgi:nucleoside-diphosphate-sugar epimerase
MSSQLSVLVLGARGRFGQAAARAFAQAGWRVLAQMRPGAQALALPGVQWIAAAPGDIRTLAAAAAGAQLVVQALSPLYTHKAWRTDVPALTADAIAVTRALGTRASPATLMLPASVYNFGASMPAVLHEDTTQAPTTFKGRLRQASEAQIVAATQDGGMRLANARLVALIGEEPHTPFPDALRAALAERGMLANASPAQQAPALAAH